MITGTPVGQRDRAVALKHGDLRRGSSLKLVSDEGENHSCTVSSSRAGIATLSCSVASPVPNMPSGSASTNE